MFYPLYKKFLFFLTLLPLPCFCSYSWNPPYNLSPSSVNGNQQFVAIDALGNMVVVWTLFNGSFYYIQSATFYAVINQWSKVQTLSSASIAPNMFPRVAISPTGRVVAIWCRYDGSYYSVESIQKQINGDWSPVTVISNTSSAPLNPQVALDGQGGGIAIWSRNITLGSVIEAAVLPPVNSSTWNSAVQISQVGQVVELPKIAVDFEGHGVALWRNQSTSQLQSAVWNPQTETWSSPTAISPTSVHSVFDLAMNPSGETIAIFSASSTVYAAQFNFSSGWFPYVTIATGTSPFNCQAAINSTGDASAIWIDNTGPTSVNTSFLLNGNSTWASITSLGTGLNSTIVPKITMDDEGHIIAVWDSDDNRVKNSLLSFNTLSWSSPSAISSESSSVPFNPILKVNSEGFAVVVWSYFNGTDFLVQALTTVNPPLALAGIKKQNRFAFSSYFLTELEWRKSPSPLVYYQIYCNGAPIARISNQQIRYLIPFVLSKEKITYSITSISSSDVESPPISVTP